MAVTRLTEFPSFQTVEQFRQARLIRVTHRRLAIGLNPFGMLDPKVIVNLFPQVCIGVDLVNHDPDLFAFISTRPPSRQPIR
jgi:hypothetical protein